MTSSPPSIDTQINTLGTIIPLINPSILSTPINTPPTSYAGTSSQHARASSQNSLGIYWPPVTMPGSNFPFTALTHYTDRPLPSIPFPNLIGTPTINTSNLNIVTQMLNLPLYSKEVMIRNIQTQMKLMQ